MHMELAKTVVDCLRLMGDAADVDRLRGSRGDWQPRCHGSTKLALLCISCDTPTGLRLRMCLSPSILQPHHEGNEDTTKRIEAKFKSSEIWLNAIFLAGSKPINHE